ncbi:MAG: hypothetical protein ACKVHA_09255 [Fidelibacterota bacterium]|jgi:hypothetical protein
MKKHIFPIISLVCVIVIIISLFYQYFEIGGITTYGWLTLLLMISMNMIYTPHWKEYFTK